MAYCSHEDNTKVYIFGGIEKQDFETSVEVDLHDLSSKVYSHKKVRVNNFILILLVS